MPRVEEYTPQVSARGVLEGQASGNDVDGGKGLSLLGEGTMAVGQQVHEVEQQQEISSVNASMAKFRADQTVLQTKMQAESEPGDPTFAARYQEQLNSSLDQLEGTLPMNTRGSRAAFDRQRAEISATLTEGAGVFQIHSAGVKSYNDFMTFVNASSAALVTDPSQFQSVQHSITDAISDPAGPYAKIPADKRAELQRTAVETAAFAALRGTASVAPDAARKQLDSGYWDKYLTPQNRERADGIVDRAQMAQLRDEQRALVAQEKQRVVNARAAENNLVSSLVKDPTQVSAAAIAENPDMTPEQKLRWVEPGGLLDRALKENDHDKTTYGPAINEVLDLVHLPDGDPRKITDENQVYSNPAWAKSLTIAGMKEVTAEIGSKRTQEGSVEADLKKGLRDLAKATLVKRQGPFDPPDPAGEAHMQTFMSWFLPEYNKQRAAGKTPVELLNPKSPEYMGKMLDTLRRTPNQIYDELMKQYTTTPPGSTQQDMSPAAIAARDPSVQVRSNGKETIYKIKGKWYSSDGSEYGTAKSE